MVVAAAGYVIPAPFRAALDRLVAEVGGIQALADRIGVHETRVRRVGVATSDGQTGLLKVVTADEWLTRLGLSVAEVYGPLYGLSTPEKDGCGESCFRCGLALRQPARLCGFCIEEGQES